MNKEYLLVVETNLGGMSVYGPMSLEAAFKKCCECVNNSEFVEVMAFKDGEFRTIFQIQ